MNGCLRCCRATLAPTPGVSYDRANQRLRKKVNEWVDCSCERTKTQRLLPIRGKTPFSSTAVKAHMKAAPPFGVVAAAALADWATGCVHREQGARAALEDAQVSVR